MASKMATDEFDEEFLTCQVCMLHFRDPKILPCLHTFCKVCLEEWATKQPPLECPICRIPVSLPDQGVDGLKTNFYVNNLLDFVAAKKGAEPGVPCQVCEGNVEGSKSWCADCAVLLCEFCAKMHHKIPAAKDHELVTQDVMAVRDGADRFHRKRHCDKHKKYELEFYCESCQALVCTACTVIDHRPGKDHNPVEITTIAQKKKEKLQELLQDMDPRLKEVQASIDEVDKNMSKLIPSKQAAKTQAKAYFRQLADLLEKREEEILRQIDEQCRADGKVLQAKKEAIEFELVGLTSAQTFCQQAVEHGSDVHVLEVGNQVQTRMETLLAKELDMESNWSEFQFIENTTVEDFVKLRVKHLGGVKASIDVSKCKVAVKQAVQGFRCVAELTTKNKEGSSCVTNSEAVTTRLKGPSRKSRFVPIQLQLKSDGVWEISYVPKVTGNHRLQVKVNSQHVPGSPFDITVQSREEPVLTIGRKGSVEGELNGPIDVTINNEGNIAVVEQTNKRVQIFEPHNCHSLKCFPVDGEKPFGVELDLNGRFLVTSWGKNYGVRRYSQEGELLNTFKPDCMIHALGLAVLKDGRMVVAGGVQESCLLLRHDGSLVREIGKGHLKNPWFIAVDESRDLFYVTDHSVHKVFVFDLEGVFKFSFGEEGQGEGQLSSPSGITLDQTGNVLVVNLDDGRVQVFRPDGTFIRTVVTVKGGIPHGITLTPDGYMAVACYTGQCIEVYRYC